MLVDPRRDGARRVALQDVRLLPVARERVKTDVLRLRRQWALVCRALGDPGPMQAYRADLEAGRLTLPPIVERQGHDPTEEPGAVELTETVETLLRVDGGATLHALAAPGHPWRAALAGLVRNQQRHGFDGRALTARPFHLQLLLDDLDDVTPVGKVTYRDGQLREESGGGTSMSSVPPGHFGDAEVLDEATLRRCDQTAARIAAALLGLPRYHPLMKDRDARLAALRAAAPRLVRSARVATRPELLALELQPAPWSPTFVPDLAALGSQVATAADVEAGRAVFHLPAGARSLGLRLPATARLKLPGGGLQPVLVVQAEVTAAGEERYGVPGVDRVEAVGADRLEAIAPFPDPEEQRAAARLFLARAAAGDEAGVLELLGPEAQAQLEQMGGLKRLLAQLREARAQVPEEQLLERLAPGFRRESDGKWRFASFR